MISLIAHSSALSPLPFVAIIAWVLSGLAIIWFISSQSMITFARSKILNTFANEFENAIEYLSLREIDYELVKQN